MEEYPNDWIIREPNVMTPRERLTLALNTSDKSTYEPTSVARVNSSPHLRYDPHLDIDCSLTSLLPLDFVRSGSICSRWILPSSSLSKKLSFTRREEEPLESGWRPRCRGIREEQDEHDRPEDHDGACNIIPVGRFQQSVPTRTVYAGR
jgi:hypothetical protein